MERRVYKSLDKPSSMLGIQGSYQRYAIAGVGAAALLGLIIGKATVGLVGFFAFAAMAIVVYLAVIRYQSKYSERERDKKKASTGLPDYLVMPTRKLSRESAYVLKHKKD